MSEAMKHTKEPWKSFKDKFNHDKPSDGQWGTIKEVLSSKEHGELEGLHICTIENCNTWGKNDGINEANAQRIVDCVNECAGLTKKQIEEAIHTWKALRTRTFEVEDLYEEEEPTA